MRIKLTHLIIVSLISLTVAFSAISNVSAGYEFGGAMAGNTTGGGRTAEMPRNPHPGYSSCRDQYKGKYNNCKKQLGDVAHCKRKARSDYYFCLCLKDDMDACMRWVMLGEPMKTEEVVLPERYKQSSHNATVDDQLATDPTDTYTGIKDTTLFAK